MEIKTLGLFCVSGAPTGQRGAAKGAPKLSSVPLLKALCSKDLKRLGQRGSDNLETFSNAQEVQTSFKTMAPGDPRCIKNASVWRQYSIFLL